VSFLNLKNEENITKTKIRIIFNLDFIFIIQIGSFLILSIGLLQIAPR